MGGLPKLGPLHALLPAIQLPAIQAPATQPRCRTGVLAMPGPSVAGSGRSRGLCKPLPAEQTAQALALRWPGETPCASARSAVARSAVAPTGSEPPEDDRRRPRSTGRSPREAVRWPLAAAEYPAGAPAGSPPLEWAAWGAR